MTITKDGMIMSELKRRIIKASADLFDLSAQELESQSRMSYLMPARFAIYKALHMRGWAYSRIGKLLGKDHSTIIYGISRADYMIERDEALDRDRDASRKDQQDGVHEGSPRREESHHRINRIHPRTLLEKPLECFPESTIAPI